MEKWETMTMDNSRDKTFVELWEADKKLAEVRRENAAILKVNSELVDTNTGLLNENEALKAKLAEKDYKHRKCCECNECQNQDCPHRP